MKFSCACIYFQILSGIYTEVLTKDWLKSYNAFKIPVWMSMTTGSQKQICTARWQLLAQHTGWALMPPAGFLMEAFQLWWYFGLLWKNRDLGPRWNRILHCYLLCVTLEKFFSPSTLIKMERLIVPIRFEKELNKNGMVLNI